jgi:hypothetical protein
MKSKGVMIGVAAGLVATALALASLSVTTTSGQSTDEEAAPTAVPTAATTTTTPPQAPVEPVTDPNAGNAANAGVAPEGLPEAGFGADTDDSSASMWILLGLAGAGMTAGAGMMVAGRGRGTTSR